MRNVYVTISRDARVRDILRLGTLERLLEEPDVRVVILTQAANDSDFVEEFASERVIIRNLRPFRATRSSRALLELRRRLPGRLLTGASYWLESRSVPANWYDGVFDEFEPSAVLLPDMIEFRDWPLAVNAKKRGVPLVGSIRSWDNIYKGLPQRADIFCVPNPQNADEAVKYEKYRRDQIVVTGAPQFDPYFQPDTLLSRDEFFRQQGLDAERNLIVMATAGAMFQFIGTEWLDNLLEAQESGAFVKPTQIISRNHPGDPLGPFLNPKYQGRPNLKLDMPKRWLRSLGWQMTREDVVYVANLLKHADVVVTPGSTFTLESAIFDTPAVQIAYSEILPEAIGTLTGFTFVKHYRGLIEEGVVDIARSRSEMVRMVNDALTDPGKGSANRKRTVERWVGPTDGKASERLAEQVLRAASSKR